MKGYKVFNKDWTCHDKQYTCPGYFEENVTPKICEVGMHFCERAIDCFNYYNFDTDNHVAEVEAVGEIDTDGKKSCTNKLKIIREIPWNEVLRLVNTGKNCRGIANTGNYNSGDFNTGSCNSGDFNTGHFNSGSYNVGYYNTGERNTGDWNFTSQSTGCFCTEKQYIRMFDKETNWTMIDWCLSNGYYIMFDCPQRYSNRQEWWYHLDQSKKQDVYDLPNFDVEKFYKCTGIKVDVHEIRSK